MSNDKPKTSAKKVFGILLNVITYLFFGLCIVALVLSVTAKKDADGAVSLWGKQLRVVVSDSMAKCDQTDVSQYKIKDIPIKSMLLIDLVPEDEQEAEAWYAALRPGDVLTFRYLYVTQETITHRIVKITPKETGGYMIDLEGDNKNSDSNTLQQTIDTSQTDSPDYVIGKVVGQSYPAGIVITAIDSPVGIICFIIVPCAIIAIFEIFRLAGALSENRRRKEREEQKKRDEEFEEMKRQLALLQQQQAVREETEANSEIPEANEHTAKAEESLNVPEESPFAEAEK